MSARASPPKEAFINENGHDGNINSVKKDKKRKKTSKRNKNVIEEDLQR